MLYQYWALIIPFITVEMSYSPKSNISIILCSSLEYFERKLLMLDKLN